MHAPLRIVSLLASATEILYGLNLDDSIVGVSHECDFPAAARTKPRLTRSLVASAASSREIDAQVQQAAKTAAPLYELDRKLLCELVPDVIITQAQCDVCAIKYDDVMQVVQSAELLRGTRVLALNPTTLGDVFRDIRRIGEATSREAAAGLYARQLEQRVEQVRQLTRDIPGTQRPRVVCVEWFEPLMVAANWTPELVEWAGGRNRLSRPGQHSHYVAWEAVVDADPEVLVLMPCGFDLQRTVQEAAVLSRRPGWSDLSATRQRRVFAVDGNAYFNRSGPRLVDSLELLGHLLHPDRCGGPPGTARGERAWSRFSP